MPYTYQLVVSSICILLADLYVIELANLYVIEIYMYIVSIPMLADLCICHRYLYLHAIYVLLADLWILLADLCTKVI